MQREATRGFDRLAPFIQEFIWKHGWTELRDVQVRACDAAFGTDNHVLIGSDTASGKTEAAFLPILTQLHEDPPRSAGAIYIGPLKALINDQFIRLNDLCLEAEIPVTAWHGDVSAARKRAFMRKPEGVLQITPEALEGLLLNHSAELMNAFGDLRWVVIDEIHAFMPTDRGGQILALLDRLSRFALDRGRLPRRIGLSATLGDYTQAAEWLAGSTTRTVEIISDQKPRTVNLLVEQFTIAPAPREPASTDDHADRDPEKEDGAAVLVRAPQLFSAAFEATQHRKSLIFTNTRADAEGMVSGLRQLSELQHVPDIYYVHHGSISPELRREAEAAMRDGDGPACTAATVTLELGIDLGQLDRVLQLGPTSTVSSFLQRLGRSGRRGQPSEMFFLLREEEHDAKDSLPDRFPWELLQTIALIQLYVEERWVEPMPARDCPGSLLYHQTMSVIGASGGLTPPELADRILTLAPFHTISQDDFRDLLRHLLATDHLQRMDEGQLILGLAGEKVVRNFRFLATFQDATEWSVKDGARDIGTIAQAVPAGERFMLAGRTWEVVELLDEQRVIIVKRVRGSLRTHFLGADAGEVHDKVVERMRRVLTEPSAYSYLTDAATKRLASARELARTTRLAERPCVISTSKSTALIVPWRGTRALSTMALQLRSSGVQATQRHFHIDVSSAPSQTGEIGGVVGTLATVSSVAWNTIEMLRGLPRAAYERDKYDHFLPDGLLARSFASQHLDPDSARNALGDALKAVASGSDQGVPR